MNLGINGLRLRCLRCGFIGYGNMRLCPRCGFPLVTEPQGLLRIDRKEPSIWRYGSVLNRGGRVVTLGEGFTRVRRVGGVLVKDESRNPTGSFMDRGSAVFISNVSGGGVRGPPPRPGEGSGCPPAGIPPSPTPPACGRDGNPWTY